MYLIESTNKNILAQFKGKKLVRTSRDTFFTENYMDGFRVSAVSSEVLSGGQLNVYTENSVYTFADVPASVRIAEPKYANMVAATPQIALYQMLMKGAC